MKNRIKKLITIGVVASSISMLPLTGASAEWKQDSKGWWNTEGNSYSIGWRQINSKWYYFDNNSYMVTNTEINGYKIDNNGVWTQNTTINSNNATNTSTNLESTTTSNSNNMTNLTSNADNSVKKDTNITLNNNGVINANTTNNVNINVKQNDDSYKKQIEKNHEDTKKTEKLYYEKQLTTAKYNLKDAEVLLEKIKSQETVYNYTKLADGTTGYKMTYDQKAYDKQYKVVESEKRNVEYYKKLINQL